MEPQIKEQIEKLIAKTKEGVIDWRQLNQQAIRWTVMLEGKQYNTTLQQLPTATVVVGKPSYQYILSIQTSAGEMILNLQSHQQLNPDYSPLLQQLFEVALAKAGEQSAEILNKLLGKL